MERLTIRGDHGIYMADGYDFEINPDDYDLVQKILDRLAAYEDTGLEPKEIVSMRHTLNEYHKDADPLLRAKVEGRLVVLPCRMDAVVYAARCYYRGKKVFRQEIVSGEIDHFTIGEAMKPIATVCFSDNEWRDHEPDELIFTREEAERALEEM